MNYFRIATFKYILNTFIKLQLFFTLIILKNSFSNLIITILIYYLILRAYLFSLNLCIFVLLLLTQPLYIQSHIIIIDNKLN